MNSITRSVVCTLWIVSAATYASPVQKHSPLPEPPIPIYNFTQLHTDSQAAVIRQSENLAHAAAQRADSLERQLAKNRTEYSDSITLLYTVIVILILVNAAILVTIFRNRKRSL